MGFGLLALGAGLIGGISNSRASRRATRSQERTSRDQLRLQQRIYNETSANFSPYRTQGLNAFNALNHEMGLGAAPANYQGFQETPGYQFAFDQGQRAIEGSAAAGGNVRSGATMKALNQFGQGVANQEYGNYMNRLGSLAQMGQAAAGNQAAAGANFANAGSNALAARGNAQAAGAIAQGNAWTSGINNALGGYMMGQTMGGGASPSINLPAQSAAGQAVFGSGAWF